VWLITSHEERVAAAMKKIARTVTPMVLLSESGFFVRGLVFTGDANDRPLTVRGTYTTFALIYHALRVRLVEPLNPVYRHGGEFS
jgi:hypothetical protein